MASAAFCFKILHRLFLSEASGPFNTHSRRVGSGLVQSIFSSPSRRSAFWQLPTCVAPRRRAKNALHYGELTITCRNWHCPKCQANAHDRWLDARCRDLLPVPTSMLSSLCLINWLRWRCRTSVKSTAFCFAPAPRLYSRWPPTSNISVLRWGSLTSYIPGISNYFRTLTHDARHYHPLCFQRIRKTVSPRTPLAVTACRSEGAAQRWYEPAWHSSPHEQSPTAPAEPLALASAGRLRLTVRSCGD